MLTDDQIIHVLRTRHPCSTYYAKNVLRDVLPDLTTPVLRRRLMKMEKAGTVERDKRWTTTRHICWVATGRAAQAASHDTNGGKDG